jgi:sulfur-oxidizing protein SoxY
MDRRTLLKSSLLLSLAATTRTLGTNTPEDLKARAEAASREQALQAQYGLRAPTYDRVELQTPPQAENGNSVPLTVTVDSPMQAQDFVREIRIIAPLNPVPLIASYRLFPGNGPAQVSARIRFNTSQTLLAVAEMNDGSLWMGESQTTITLEACLEALL